MAGGTGLGSLIPVAMTLAGIVAMLRARRNRRAGRTENDLELDRRLAETAETNRRMAAYLAQRDSGRGTQVVDDIDEQENRR